MIAIPRSLLRRCRSVFKRLCRRERAVVTFESDNDGLRIRLQRTQIPAEYHEACQQGNHDPFGIPMEALGELEGRDGSVSLELRDGKVIACWQDGGIPREVSYDAVDLSTLTYPTKPDQVAAYDQTLLQALADASDTVAKDGTRYALQNIQLRGRGDIVATDGRQLLEHRGFLFGWPDDVLVPACSVFGQKELQGEESVGLARLDKHIIVATGPWTVYLPINKEGRYPRTEEIIPSENKVATRCRFTSDDAAFLSRSLPRLPGELEVDSPVTLDLNGHVLVRGKGEGQQRPTELVLDRSAVEGVPVRMKTNRNHLGRALKLGFSNLHIVNADTPTVCRDQRRIYVWMPLGKQGAIAPSDDAIRIHSTQGLKVESTTNERTIPPMKQAEVSRPDPVPEREPDNGQATQNVTFASLIEEAQSLRTSLREAYDRSSHLVTALKKQRKQSQLLKSTLASLRELQQIGQ